MKFTIVQEATSRPKPFRLSWINLPPLAKAIGLGLALAIAMPAAAQTTPAKAEPPPPKDAPANTESTQAEPQLPATAPTQTRLLPKIEQQQMALLADQLDDPSVVWLESEHEQFLALYEPDISGAPVGAVLLLHAEGQHADWPNTMQVIRNSLPEYGWATLATTLPAPDRMPPPERQFTPPPSVKTVADENSAAATDASDKETQAPNTQTSPPESEILYDTATGDLGDGSITEPPPPVEKATDSVSQVDTEVRAMARIRAALAYLNEMGQFNIALVGDSSGAVRGGAFISQIPTTTVSRKNEQAIKPIVAMVIINARNQLPMSDNDLSHMLYDPEIPVLDIWADTDPRNAQEAEQRRKFTKRKRFSAYQQLAMPVMSDNVVQGENWLARRIRGFLSRHAKGSEVDNATIIKR